MTVELDHFLSAYPIEVQVLARQTRELILANIPNVLELVDPPSRIVAYGFGTRNKDLICAISPTKAYVNLIFSQGAALPDPHHVLEGTGKRARHIKIAAVEKLAEPGVREMITTARNSLLSKPLNH
ncbi:MAG TPA: DUF1801 domain-containing protein [Anaerolineaceae bacterium]